MSTSGCRTLSFGLASGQLTITFEAAMVTPKMLVGKTPEAAAKLVGVLHNLCAQAHCSAARAATGLPVPVESARHVMLEILREHLVVLCRSAPPLAGVEPVTLPLAFSRLGAAFAPGEEGMQAALWQALFASSPGASFSFEALRQGILAPFLSALASREKALGLYATDFALADEPTFFARVKDDPAFRAAEGCGPLSLRMLGRLFEIHRLLLALGANETADYLPRQSEAGVAHISAARGALIHRAQLKDGVIERYAIETPTAAMLAQDGPLHGFILRLVHAPGADESLVRIALLAFDPCVPYALTFLEGRGAPGTQKGACHA